MLDFLSEIVEDLIDSLFNSMESIARAIMKKHFLIRLPIFSIMWMIWLILFPIYMVVYSCMSFGIDIELFLIYFFCLVWLATIILYPHEIQSNYEQYEWIKENLKRWSYISFFDDMYLMNLEDVMAFKLRWI